MTVCTVDEKQGIHVHCGVVRFENDVMITVSAAGDRYRCFVT